MSVAQPQPAASASMGSSADTVGSSTADLSAARAPRFILTIACPGTTGIVAESVGFLARHRGLIVEAQHFNDAETGTSFMRIVFRDDGRGLHSLTELRYAFARDVAHRLGVEYRMRESLRKCRIVLAVSQHGRYLSNLLHRWSAGTLPVDVAAVVSNHEAARGLADAHRIPFHHYPLVGGCKEEQEGRIISLFEDLDAELLVLARYTQILTEHACGYFEGRAISAHQSFLTGFKGAKACHPAHPRGIKMIGATAHYVTRELHEGPIIEQAVHQVDHAVAPEDLLDIGSDLESLVLTRSVGWHAEQRVFRNGHCTVVLQ
jgi:formyltetrahydrofolate deformylase